MATLPLSGHLASINVFWRNTYVYSVSILQLSGARLNRSPPLHHFWASNLFPWLNHLSLPIWSGMKDISCSTENKHHENASIWCPLETFSYFFRKQNAVLRLCCVLTNTRESVIASRVWVHARLCTSWYISRWSVYYCFCPCLKASDWQGAEGTRSSAAFSHIQCVGESGRPLQLAVLAETTTTTERLNHTDGRAFNTALPSVSHKHHPHSYQRRSWWKKQLSTPLLQQSHLHISAFAMTHFHKRFLGLQTKIKHLGVKLLF